MTNKGTLVKGQILLAGSACRELPLCMIQSQNEEAAMGDTPLLAPACVPGTAPCLTLTWVENQASTG